MAGTQSKRLMKTLSKMKHFFFGLALVLIMTWLVPALADKEEVATALASSLGSFFTRAVDVAKIFKN